MSKIVRNHLKYHNQKNRVTKIVERLINFIDNPDCPDFFSAGRNELFPALASGIEK